MKMSRVAEPEAAPQVVCQEGVPLAREEGPPLNNTKTLHAPDPLRPLDTPRSTNSTLATTYFSYVSIRIFVGVALVSGT